jgi:predicted transcriptional regulator
MIGYRLDEELKAELAEIAEKYNYSLGAITIMVMKAWMKLYRQDRDRALSFIFGINSKNWE